MNTFFLRRDPFEFKRKYCVCLSVGWIFGLLSGWYAAIKMQPSLVSSAVELVGYFRMPFFKVLSVCLPFLFSAIAVYCSVPGLILLISVLKAIFFAFCCCYLEYFFGSCSWLLRLLLLFSDICSIPVVFFYWLRHFEGNIHFSLQEHLWLSVFLMIVLGIDYFIVTPYAVELLSF